MRDYVELGTTPVLEQCVGVTDKKPYFEEMKKEARRYKLLLEKLHPQLPSSCYFKIKEFNHDFGMYCEVCLYYDDDFPLAEEFAYNLQGNQPEYWYDAPKVESIEDAIEWAKSTYTLEDEVCTLSCYMGKGKFRLYMQDGCVKELQIPIANFRQWYSLYKESHELEDKMMELERRDATETNEYKQVVERINDISVQTLKILEEEYGK